MEVIKAKFLLENLLERVEVLDDGSRQLSGKLTENEIKALKLAISMLDGAEFDTTLRIAPTASSPDLPPRGEVSPSLTMPSGPETVPSDGPVVECADSGVALNLSVLDSARAPANMRLCLDFGTAMSKATLVEDFDDGFEDIQVLKLGIPGDQEEISEIMLVSSVFIDEHGCLWFGKHAIEEALHQPEGSNRQQLDNIKRYLSEEGLNASVSQTFNPSGIDVTYGDLILGYLTYLTWCVNHALEDLGGSDRYPRNLARRFAMPCLSEPAASEAEYTLRRYLGEAQILADTFSDVLSDGLPLESFMSAVSQLRSLKPAYSFVAERITEPLGVAGSLLGPHTRTNMLAMVVDVGAGTTDFSLYRIAVDPQAGTNVASEVKNSARCLTEAGNHLDKLLKSVIMREAKVSSCDPLWPNLNWELERNIRSYKETLFDEGEVFVFLRELNSEVTIKLTDFLKIPQVKAFGDNLRTMMTDIMNSVDSEFARWVAEEPMRRLVVVLTGGGASLPMVQDLAEGWIVAHGLTVHLARAKSFPSWLDEEYANLEDDYARIAVSLGGARKTIIESGGVITTTGRAGRDKPRLEGYFVKGV